MKKKTNTPEQVDQKFDFRSIKTFEDACSRLGLNPTQLPDFSKTGEEFSRPLIAYYKLIVICRAINNDGWRPDWSNRQQYKYYPWFAVLSSWFDFSHSDYYFSASSTSVGSRLCVDSSEKALWLASQFQDLYKDYLLYSE